MKNILITVIMALSLWACATPRDEIIQHEGRTVMVHIDYTDNPCGTRGWSAGCSSKDAEGKQHIWVSGVAPTSVINHELDHYSMKHGTWYDHKYFGWCTEVLETTHKYVKGSLICLNNGVERTVPPGFIG